MVRVRGVGLGRWQKSPNGDSLLYVKPDFKGVRAQRRRCKKFFEPEFSCSSRRACEHVAACAEELAAKAVIPLSWPADP